MFQMHASKWKNWEKDLINCIPNSPLSRNPHKEPKNQALPKFEANGRSQSKVEMTIFVPDPDPYPHPTGSPIFTTKNTQN
jgi:hypothetical protein